MTKGDAQLALLQPEHTDSTALRTYALVELFGHQRIVGLVMVDPPEFPGMIRVDVPNLVKENKLVRSGFTRYIGRAAVYGITPIDEAVVLNMLPHIDGRPTRPMEIGDDRY
jgi:hypothetical protein